jgi:hypothetical protein
LVGLKAKTLAYYCDEVLEIKKLSYYVLKIDLFPMNEASDILYYFRQCRNVVARRPDLAVGKVSELQRRCCDQNEDGKTRLKKLSRFKWKDRWTLLLLVFGVAVSKAVVRACADRIQSTCQRPITVRHTCVPASVSREHAQMHYPCACCGAVVAVV